MKSRATVLCALGLAFAGPGCKSMAGTLPTWEEPDGGGAVAAADGATAEPDDAIAGAEGGAPDDEEAAPAGDEVPTAAADATDPPVAELGRASESTGAEASPPPATLELPAPVHAKIDKKCGKDPGVGERLKAFDLPTTDGGKVTQATYRGRVLVVNFWGTWCKPCLKELPEFDQLYRRYRKHGMTLLAIATDEDPTPVDEFKKKRRLAAKLAIGGEDYAGQYSSSQFPFTFVVDTKGVIKASFRGYKPECMGKLEDEIRKELTKRAQARG